MLSSAPAALQSASKTRRTPTAATYTLAKNVIGDDVGTTALQPPLKIRPELASELLYAIPSSDGDVLQFAFFVMARLGNTKSVGPREGNIKLRAEAAITFEQSNSTVSCGWLVHGLRFRINATAYAFGPSATGVILSVHPADIVTPQELRT